MKTLRIGYWPLSSNLQAAGDRRRLVFWAGSRGHTITQDLHSDIDVIIASENSDFNSRIFLESKIPVVLDLVDSYLTPLNFREDLARGFAKRLTKGLTGPIKPFSEHVKEFCRNSKIVICSSIEQAAIVREFNANTHVILDFHEEIPYIDFSDRIPLKKDNNRILWEGQPATIGGINQITSTLLELVDKYEIELDLVTDTYYYKTLNKYFKMDTIDLLRKDLGQISRSCNLITWSTSNLFDTAAYAKVAMIPIDLSIPMQSLKPENRLLIMWRMGLPCLTSPSHAYRRVAEAAGVDVICNSMDEWLQKFGKMLEDPSFRSEQILGGQNYLRENHNKSILLKKWDTAIESALS